jgi:hypothetical protein
MNQIGSGMNPWTCVLLISVAGSIGGLLNSFMSDNGFALPRRIEGVWCPGALWNIFVGSISALTSWALYGSGAGIDLASSSPSPKCCRPFVSFTSGCPQLVRGPFELSLP